MHYPLLYCNILVVLNVERLSNACSASFNNSVKFETNFTYFLVGSGRLQQVAVSV